MISFPTLARHVARALRVALPVMWDSTATVADPLRFARVIVNGERRRSRSEARLGVPVPRFCIVSVTWRCNLRCVGCYTKGYDQQGELPLDTVARVIDEANRLGSYFFVVVGGEPLLVPGLIETLGRFPGALFFMFTNATLLTPRHARAIKAARTILPIISVEGHKRLTDHRRGGGVGHKAAAAMDALRRSNIPFGFSSMVTHRNLHCVTSRAWLDEIWQAGARFGFLIDYVPIPPDVDPGMVLTDDDRAFKTDKVARRFYEARPMVLNFPPDEYTSGDCQAAGRGMVHINADGNVEPCPFCHYAADNIRERSVAEALGSPFLREIRARLGHAPNPRGECLLFSHLDEVRAIAGETGASSTEGPGARRLCGLPRDTDDGSDDAPHIRDVAR